MEERESIVDVVLNDPNLKKIVDDLVEKQFLIAVVFDSMSYIRDADAIYNAWGTSKSRLNAIAMGSSLYNQLFQEGSNSLLQGGDFSPSQEIKNDIENWKDEVKKLFVSEFNEIENIARTIGQFLEFTNRKAQGF